jgi:catechol 2,3-dioxygenase-like lactoylglutathione lyase family enzyme
MSLVLDQVQHVVLGVTNLERSLQFYRDVLGMTVRLQIPGLAFLEAGSFTLALSEPLGRSVTPIAGAMEVVFAVENVTLGHATLVERGVDFVREPRPVTEHDVAATFRDPDGHLLTLFGPAS